MGGELIDGGIRAVAVAASATLIPAASRSVQARPHIPPTSSPPLHPMACSRWCTRSSPPERTMPRGFHGVVGSTLTTLDQLEVSRRFHPSRRSDRAYPVGCPEQYRSPQFTSGWGLLSLPIRRLQTLNPTPPPHSYIEVRRQHAPEGHAARLNAWVESLPSCQTLAFEATMLHGRTDHTKEKIVKIFYPRHFALLIAVTALMLAVGCHKQAVPPPPPPPPPGATAPAPN